MTRLCRLTRFGQSELKRYLSAGGRLPAPVGDDAGWYEPCPGGGNLESFLAWYETGANSLERDDAKAAASFHRSFQPPRRVVCDTAFWAWLAAFPGATYTEMRWREKEQISAERVGTKIWVNALARLWWGAEFTRVDQPAEILRVFGLAESLDPYAFASLLVGNPQLEAALLQRVLAQSRTVAVSFIALVEAMGSAAMPSEKVFELARRLHLAGSTTVLDAFDADRAPERPYAVSVNGARACGEFLRELLRDDGELTQARPHVAPRQGPNPAATKEGADERRPSGFRGWWGGLFREGKPKA